MLGTTVRRQGSCVLAAATPHRNRAWSLRLAETGGFDAGRRTSGPRLTCGGLRTEQRSADRPMASARTPEPAPHVGQRSGQRTLPIYRQCPSATEGTTRSPSCVSGHRVRGQADKMSAHVTNSHPASVSRALPSLRSRLRRRSTVSRLASKSLAMASAVRTPRAIARRT